MVSQWSCAWTLVCTIPAARGGYDTILTLRRDEVHSLLLISLGDSNAY